MDLFEINVNNIEQLVAERNNCLPPLLSSLDDVDNCTQLLENVKLCTKYLSTYNISEVEQELLQYVVPAVKKSLLKLYDDNFLLSDTVEEEFVLKILKENLQVAVGFTEVIKTVLTFLSQNTEINLTDLNITPTNLAQLIFSTFKHCKNGTDVYKQSFNEELLELFKVTQEVHLLFLKLFETNIVIKNEAESTRETKTLIEVLDIICCMGDILSELNIKSMSDNWKGYTAVAHKFSVILAYNIDLKLPLLSLSHEINKNLSSIEYQDVTLVTQVVKITGFLIKVALKICDTFWKCLETVLKEIFTFCCTIYSFPIDLFRSQGHPPEILTLIENSIFKIIEPLLPRLLNDLTQIFSVGNMHFEKYPFGLVNFLNNVLKTLVLNQTKIPLVKVEDIIQVMFSNISLCFVEFFWEGPPTDCIFDSLVVNITAVVLLFDDCYEKIEIILLQNLLGGHIFASVLAMEVWTLLLRNSTPQFIQLTLTNLLQKWKEVGFGVLTARPERIFFKCFIQRVFKMLPNAVKNDFVLRYNPVRSMDYWKVIQFGNFPVQQRLSIEGVCMVTLTRMEALGAGRADFKDVIFIADNLTALSTVNFVELGLNPSNLAKAVSCFWEFSLEGTDLAKNNIFKYFLAALCKVTCTVFTEFNPGQLATVLSQLKLLSADDSYKVLTCHFLYSLGSTPVEISEDSLTLIAEIICQYLLTAPCNVIKQRALEVVQNFATNSKNEVVKFILLLSGNMQGLVSNYLSRNVVETKFDKEYLASLKNIAFNHQCISWRNDTGFPKPKKFKIEPNKPATVEAASVEKLYKKTVVEKPTVKASKWCKNAETTSKVDSVGDSDNIADVLANIKGEVKCLGNVLKTEKLTPKNASDIRLIANQLLSFL